MKLLLDSNVLYWTFFNREALSPHVRQLVEDDQNELFASRASLWELSAKVAAGRLPMKGSTIQTLLDRIAMADLTVLELENQYILRTEALPYHHSDPFDRLLIAQAMEEGLTILSSDSKLPLYDVPVIWQ